MEFAVFSSLAIGNKTKGSSSSHETLYYYNAEFHVDSGINSFVRDNFVAQRLVTLRRLVESIPVKTYHSLHSLCLPSSTSSGSFEKVHLYFEPVAGDQKGSSYFTLLFTHQQQQQQTQYREPNVTFFGAMAVVLSSLFVFDVSNGSSKKDHLGHIKRILDRVMKQLLNPGLDDCLLSYGINGAWMVQKSAQESLTIDADAWQSLVEAMTSGLKGSSNIVFWISDKMGNLVVANPIWQAKKPIELG